VVRTGLNGATAQPVMGVILRRRLALSADIANRYPLGWSLAGYRVLGAAGTCYPAPIPAVSASGWPIPGVRESVCPAKTGGCRLCQQELPEDVHAMKQNPSGPTAPEGPRKVPVAPLSQAAQTRMRLTAEEESLWEQGQEAKRQARRDAAAAPAAAEATATAEKPAKDAE
jgi:hypothetical protein